MKKVVAWLYRHIVITKFISTSKHMAIYQNLQNKKLYISTEKEHEISKYFCHFYKLDIGTVIRNDQCPKCYKRQQTLRWIYFHLCFCPAEWRSTRFARKVFFPRCSQFYCCLAHVVKVTMLFKMKLICHQKSNF